jgi:hypothetical protein
LLFFGMSGQALCKYCTSVGTSCFWYMRWLISLYQSLHCFWSIICVLVPSPLNTNWSLLDSVSSVWGWGSWSCHAFPRSTPTCGLVPTCRMKKCWGENEAVDLFYGRAVSLLDMQCLFLDECWQEPRFCHLLLLSAPVVILHCLSAPKVWCLMWYHSLPHCFISKDFLQSCGCQLGYCYVEYEFRCMSADK